MTDPCPCGSGEAFARCCGPYLDRTETAPTAEALMRSRYTAYARSDVAHLERTLWPRRRRGFDPRATLEWNADVVWTGLQVHAARGGAGDAEGEVAFTATYRKAGQPGEVHEVSRFRKKDGQWFYVDGRVGGAAGQAPAPAVAAGPRVGRNEPCPCGSGKKFKRCCG